MKSVLFSIQPQWCNLIDSRKKTIEVRKNIPKLKPPFKCYIYCTKGNIDICPKKIWWKKDSTGFEHILNGKVIGEFVCDGIYKFISHMSVLAGQPCYDEIELDEACVTAEQAEKYSKGKDLYGLHISDLKIYGTPKELSVFHKYGYENDYEAYCSCGGGIPISFNESNYKITRPPQSWCYVEELPE